MMFCASPGTAAAEDSRGRRGRAARLGPAMGPDGLWRRIRWGNVARLTALVALAIVVAVWPRLRGGPPRLPPAAAVPLGGAGTTDPAVTRPRHDRGRAQAKQAPKRRPPATKRPRPLTPKTAKRRRPGASHTAKRPRPPTRKTAKRRRPPPPPIAQRPQRAPTPATKRPPAPPTRPQAHSQSQQDGDPPA